MLLTILAANTETMLFRARVWLLLIFSLFTTAVFSQEQWPGTFLWRISGKNLTQPSYLYGTIHLQDKRLFQFTDSLYQALEKTEGFALEIDFNEFMDSIFSRGFRDVEDEILEKQEVKLDRKKMNKSADSLLKVLEISENRITKKDLKKIREYRMNKLVQQGEMQTIVDGYLYGLAQRLGKWMGGIEDVTDQLDLKDEIGADLTPDEIFQPEANLRRSLDELIRIYINRDLQSIANYVDGKYENGMKDKLLTQRNIKMAKRMDSLMAVRTMFFGIGAAHLPGDIGVINLLRRNGFTVEPVFSPQSLPPEAYASKLNVIPWKKVEDEKLFSIEMPGVPSDYNMLGEGVKMKVFFDLPTMTFYMAGHTIAGNNNTVDLDEALEKMAKNMGSKGNKIQAKEIMIEGVRGREGVFEIPGASFKVRLLQKKTILYMLFVGTTRNSNLSNPGINKFFSSFIPKEIGTSEKQWTKFTIPGKAFSVQLPGAAKPNKKVDESAQGTNWNFVTYDLIDEEKGFYYLVQVRDINPGFYLEGDSTYFSLVSNDLADRFEKIISEEKLIFQGWPALKLTVSENTGMLLKMFNVVRGNRVYVLVVAGGTKDSDFSDVDKVFNSLVIEDYLPSQWTKFSSEGFSATVPAPIKKMPKDSTSSDSDILHYVSYNSNDAISYEILKTPLSPYYWAKNDSSFFADRLKFYMDYADSVLEKRISYNGKLKGLDFVIQKEENNLEKLRMFVNGDTLYTLMTFLPKKEINSENFKKFFDELRVDKEILPTIYTKKTEQLLDALRTKDTTEFEKAVTAFDQVNFEKDDLPFLHKALLEEYNTQEAEHYSVNERIVEVLEDIADTSTIRFVSDNYRKLSKEKEAIKYNLLEVLSQIKTLDSYSVLKNLLLTAIPSEGDPGNLNYHLQDSLELTAKLYPEVLVLSKDSAFSTVLVNVTKQLLDSNLISINSILPFKQNFLEHVRKNLKKIKEDEEKWWMFTNWVPFIGKFNDKESNDLLRTFLTLDEIDAKYAVILALVKNEQPVEPGQTEKVAEDKEYRKDLYDEFKKLDKLKLFPARYATQLKIAESEIHLLATDDEEPSSITFISERTEMFMGKKQKFYLFKVEFEGEDYSSSYLGVTGPYSLSGKDIITSTDASGVYWDEEYDKKKIDEHLKSLLSEMEAYIKENPQTSIIK